MAFSINTNVASLSAQNYLRINSNFQNQTINRVTSGLRIVQSGDDAAGLAIANSYRSDQAVLTQGVRNANDGLSQLQIIDGGMNNISQLLDRARTLATQSASGTFTGDRSVLNSEFQSVLGEIDRQAQSIGLDTGGIFARNLAVFIGGGKTNGAGNAITNGSVSVDLSRSTVDSKSLGLLGVQAHGVAGTDIGTGAVATKVSDILANTVNTNTEVLSGYTDFYFSGPGFSDSSRVKVSVNLSGVTDVNTLVEALNAAIQNAGNTGGSQAATAFKNANITASAIQDASNKKQIAFSSSDSAFQVEAGDRVSNALLGNFERNATMTGTDMASTINVSGGGNATQMTLQMEGADSAHAVNINISAALTAAGITGAPALTNLSKADVVAALNATQAFSDVATASLSGNQAVIKSKNNSASSQVYVQYDANDLANRLGLTASAATSAAAAAASTGADLRTTVTGGGVVSNATNSFGTDLNTTQTVTGGASDILVLNGTSVTVAAGTAISKAQLASAINAAIVLNGTAGILGITASVGYNNAIVLTNANGTFTVGGAAETLAGFAVNAATSSGYTLNSNDAMVVKFEGAGLSSPVSLSLATAVAGTTTLANVLSDLQTKVSANNELAAAGITVTTASAGNKLVFTNSKSDQFRVSVDGDSANLLGMGSFLAGASGAFQYSTITSTNLFLTGTFDPNDVSQSANLEISLNGGGSFAGNPITVNLKNAYAYLVSLTIDLAMTSIGASSLDVSLDGMKYTAGGILAGDTVSTIVAKINAALNGNGIYAAITGTGLNGHVVLYTTTAGANLSVLSSSSANLLAIVGQRSAQGYTKAQIEADTVSQIKAAVDGNATLSKAGISASYTGDQLTISSGNGTLFRLASSGNGDLGFGMTGSAFAGNAVAASPTSARFDSQGASASATLSYSGIRLGDDDQTVSISATDATGNNHSIGIKLQNDSTAQTGQTVDDAIHTINLRLQQSNDSTLNQIFAVKENGVDASGNPVEKIRFVSTVPAFQVSLGATPGGGGFTLPSSDTANVDVAAVMGIGVNASITDQASAQRAVTALASAVTSLGGSQAAVGRGENQFNYAVNLAQSQLTNLATAESRIRDADLAAEAANLTKAQILMQAGVAALAQANSAPQQVLSLLRGQS